MASITVRNLDEGLKQRLRARAAGNGRSMEQEVREILEAALGPEPEPMTGKEWVASIRALVEPLGGVELEIPPRTPMRPPPTFD